VWQADGGGSEHAVNPSLGAWLRHPCLRQFRTAPRPPAQQHQRGAPPNGCAPASHCMLRSAARPLLQISESRCGRDMAGPSAAWMAAAEPTRTYLRRVLSCHAHTATFHSRRARRCRTQNLSHPQTIFPRVATIRVNALSLGFFSSQTSPARSSCPVDVTACHCLPGVMPYECCRSG